MLLRWVYELKLHKLYIEPCPPKGEGTLYSDGDLLIRRVTTTTSSLRRQAPVGEQDPIGRGKKLPGRLWLYMDCTLPQGTENK